MKMQTKVIKRIYLIADREIKLCTDDVSKSIEATAREYSTMYNGYFVIGREYENGEIEVFEDDIYQHGRRRKPERLPKWATK